MSKHIEITKADTRKKKISVNVDRAEWQQFIET